MNFNRPKSQILKDINKMHTVDIVKLYNEESAENKLILIEIMPYRILKNIFLELEDDDILSFFNQLDDVRKRVLLNELDKFELKRIYVELDDVDKEHLNAFLVNDRILEIETLLKLDETKAVSIMHSDFIKININLNVAAAMRQLIDEVDEQDVIDNLFVVDDNEVLIGKISLKKLIIARKNEQIKDLVIKNYVSLHKDDKLSLAITKISNYDLKLIPIIDDNNVLLGVVSADDILDEIAFDYEENVQKFVAVGDFKEESSPIKRSMQRIPWLLASIVLNLVIALFLSIFSNTLELVTALVLFQPLILGMAGNIGTQSIAVTILKLDKEENSDNKKHIFKEMAIGLINGLIIASLGFVLSFFVLSLDIFLVDSVFLLSLTVGLSLFFSMVLANLFGVLIPIILVKLKIDPAAASGPVISTINDLVALFIYFGFATLIILPMINVV
jgi:magnesium transporter